MSLSTLNKTDSKRATTKKSPIQAEAVKINERPSTDKKPAKIALIDLFEERPKFVATKRPRSVLDESRTEREKSKMTVENVHTKRPRSDLDELGTKPQIPKMSVETVDTTTGYNPRSLVKRVAHIPHKDLVDILSPPTTPENYDYVAETITKKIAIEQKMINKQVKHHENIRTSETRQRIVEKMKINKLDVKNPKINKRQEKHPQISIFQLGTTTKVTFDPAIIQAKARSLRNACMTKAPQPVGCTTEISNVNEGHVDNTTRVRTMPILVTSKEDSSSTSELLPKKRNIISIPSHKVRKIVEKKIVVRTTKEQKSTEKNLPNITAATTKENKPSERKQSEKLTLIDIFGNVEPCQKRNKKEQRK